MILFKLQNHSRHMETAVNLQLHLAITFVPEVTWRQMEPSTQKMNATLRLLWPTLLHNGKSLMQGTGLQWRMLSNSTFKMLDT